MLFLTKCMQINMGFRMSEINKQNGFSLIELMIVVAIIGVIASIAIPSYSEYMVRSNRTEAMEVLSQVMVQQQRSVLRQRTYTADLTQLGYPNPLLSDGGRYQITAAACAGVNINRCVNLLATPVAGGTQVADGVMTLNSRGQKTLNGVAGWDQR